MPTGSWRGAFERRGVTRICQRMKERERGLEREGRQKATGTRIRLPLPWLSVAAERSCMQSGQIMCCILTCAALTLLLAACWGEGAKLPRGRFRCSTSKKQDKWLTGNRKLNNLSKKLNKFTFFWKYFLKNGKLLKSSVGKSLKKQGS